MTKQQPITRTVAKTNNRNHSPEYIVQLDESLATALFPDGNTSEFILVRNSDNDLRPEIHARYQITDLEGETNVGLDFTLRYALALTAESDLEYSEADNANDVEIEPTTNPEPKQWRQLLNRVVGVRPQICRVRMGVFPDLEDRICRVPESTMEIVGIEAGDYICIESSSGIIRSVKAFPINEQIKRKKDDQMAEYPEYYRSCKEVLNLSQLRKTEVDIPMIFLDEETRRDLRIDSRPNKGVCQPVRIYRDPMGVLTKSAYEISIPVALVFVAGALEPTVTGLSQLLLTCLALGTLSVGFLIKNRTMLGGIYGFNSFPWK